MSNPLSPNLIDKYVEGTATPEEIDLIHDWFSSFDDSNVVINAFEQDIEGRLRKSIGLPVAIVKSQKTTNHLTRISYTVAAVVIATLIFGLLYLSKQKANVTDLAQASAFKPLGTLAKLKLADGRTVVLSGHSSNDITDNEGNLIISLKNQVITYRPQHVQYNNPSDKLNQLVTPRGAHAQIVLPDGSHVWLNAASVLTFPSNFSDKERKIELSGEAYIEVTKDSSRPFRVFSRTQMVEVLGTHFNISAYPDESVSSTTLYEGKIKIKGKEQSLILAPGEQARRTSYTLAKQIKPDLEQSIAWKSGNLVFNHENIESVMRKVARWYDLDVQYVGPIPSDYFGGSVSTEESADKILHKLQMTGQVHFKIEGRRVMVMQ